MTSPSRRLPFQKPNQEGRQKERCKGGQPKPAATSPRTAAPSREEAIRTLLHSKPHGVQKEASSSSSSSTSTSTSFAAVPQAQRSVWGGTVGNAFEDSDFDGLDFELLDSQVQEHVASRFGHVVTQNRPSAVRVREGISPPS